MANKNACVSAHYALQYTHRNTQPGASNMDTSKQDTVTMTWQANGRNWRELRTWNGRGFQYFTQYEYAPGLWL